jgi:hypothetical protein
VTVNQDVEEVNAATGGLLVLPPRPEAAHCAVTCAAVRAVG